MAINTVVAVLANNVGATFNVVARLPAKVVAVFQLVSTGGLPLPQTYSGGGSSWTITGGHYYLADDGTYEFGYELGSVPPPVTISSCNTYIAGVNAFDFYLAPWAYPGSMFYPSSAGFFAHGTVSDGMMTVNYADIFDFEDEVYVRVAGSSNSSASKGAGPRRRESAPQREGGGSLFVLSADVLWRAGRSAVR